MAFKATLNIDGKEFALLECLSVMEQKIDSKGKPVSGVRAGMLQMIVDGTDDDTLPAWASDKTRKHDGTITIYQFDMESKAKEIKFEKAFVTCFYESYVGDVEMENMFQDAIVFSHKYDQRSYTHLNRAHTSFGSSYLFLILISAKRVFIDGIAHDNW